ncbi:hypothetical protein [Streptomyces guryensis]|uniref:Uncharacterized protein n=1 Tax=Streptomyces guryensis TaxID=2886947 RepID=A0A9Q3Z5T1_9ACTN|nr:hypothetical protein [Streptomyces guryensis]MCD9875263.1 hypothetical protein [Streptomyces guryensis]
MKVSQVAPVDSLAFVGKSWHKRGLIYWVVRTFVALFFFLMTGLVFAAAVGITIGIIDAGASPWVVVPVVVAASASSTFITVRSVLQKQREQAHVGDHELKPERARDGEARARSKRIGGSVGALGYGLRALGGIGAFFAAICVPIAVGVVPVILWFWLKPLVPGELRARRKLARWLTVHGREDEIPAGWKIP